VTSEMDPRRSEFWGPMVYGFGSLWVLGPELERLSPATMRLVATVELPGGDNDIATGLGAVWVSDDEGEAVLRVDPREERISRTYDVTGGPLDVAVGADAVWATNEAGTVARIDPRTGEVAAAPVGGTPRGLDVGAGAVWVSVF
jgi:streptogramin lyase